MARGSAQNQGRNRQCCFRVCVLKVPTPTVVLTMPPCMSPCRGWLPMLCAERSKVTKLMFAGKGLSDTVPGDGEHKGGKLPAACGKINVRSFPGTGPWHHCNFHGLPGVCVCLVSPPAHRANMLQRLQNEFQMRAWHDGDGQGGCLHVRSCTVVCCSFGFCAPACGQVSFV